MPFPARRRRPLADSAPARAELLPDLPTLAEAGLPGFESMTTFALFEPTGTAIIFERHRVAAS
jgi:tripartite-type tricarboxylate transporter receptor subunit TctC